jgi:hypothetical protein
MRGKRQRDGLTGGGAGCDPAVRHAQTAEAVAFGHARSGGAPTVRRGLGQQRGAASDNGVVGRRFYGAGMLRCHVA